MGIFIFIDNDPQGYTLSCCGSFGLGFSVFMLSLAMLWIMEQFYLVHTYEFTFLLLGSFRIWRGKLNIIEAKGLKVGFRTQPTTGFFSKVHIFWEGHKILKNLHRRFVLCSVSQIYVGDLAKMCGLLRI